MPVQNCNCLALQFSNVMVLLLGRKFATYAAVLPLNLWAHPACLQASLVRMPRCSHLYITTVLLQHPEDVVEAVGLGHLLNAAACSAAGSQLVEEIDSSPTRREYPGWFLPARPASSMQQLVNDWHVKLQDVKVMFEQRVAENRCEELQSKVYTWQGSSCYVAPEAEEDQEPASSSQERTASAKNVTLGCYVYLTAYKQQLCKIDCRCLLLRAGSRRAADAVDNCRIEAYFGQNRNWGVTTFVFNGGTTAWQEAKQQLRAAHAVHADGCLHIQVIVTGMA